MRAVNEKCPIKDWEAFGEALALNLESQLYPVKWTVEPKPEDYRPEYVTLTSDTGAKLVFSMLWSAPERVEITGLFPTGFRTRYDEKPYEITASLTKTASQIARDVKVRLFTGKGYGVRLEEAKAQVADEAARDAQQADTLQSLANLLNGSVTLDRNKGKPEGASVYIVGASPARFEYTGGYPSSLPDNPTTVSLEARWIPLELAETLAVVVARYNADKSIAAQVAANVEEFANG